MSLRSRLVPTSLPAGSAAALAAALLLCLPAAAQQRRPEPPAVPPSPPAQGAPAPPDAPAPDAPAPDAPPATPEVPGGERHANEDIFPPGRRSPGDAPVRDPARVECFARADALVSLDEEAALRLCEASESDAPVRCYELARSGLLDEQRAVRLCQFATSPGPAECYLAARHRTFLEENDIVQLCRPTFFDVLVRPPSPYD